MLEKAKKALQINGNVLDSEIEDLLTAAELDLGIAGVEYVEADAIVQRAIISYVAYQFETIHGNLDRAAALKKAYDENKAMLGMSTGYTVWG